MPEKKKPTAGEAYDERASALMRAIEARRAGASSPSDSLPPYRQKFADDVADFEQLMRESYEDTYGSLGARGKELARRDAENAARRMVTEYRPRSMPVTARDIGAMRDLLARPGETSGYRDPIDFLPEDIAGEGGIARGLERERRAMRASKKNGK